MIVTRITSFFMRPTVHPDLGVICIEHSEHFTEVHMTRCLFFAALLLALLLPAHASADDYAIRQMADNEYDTAQKVYRSAVKEYGKNLEELPADEKASACKKIGWALNDNRIQYELADPFTLMKYRRQVNNLNKYNAAFGCTQ